VASGAPRRSRTSRRHQIPAFVSALLVAIGYLVFTGATPAQADTEAQIEAKIDRQWAQLEPVIEDYNRLNSNLQTQRAKVKVLQKKIQPLQLSVDTALGQVGVLSKAMYERGPNRTLTTLLDSDNSLVAFNVLGTVEQMAFTQRRMVAGAVAQIAKLKVQQKPINDLVASLNLQTISLKSKANDIQTQITAMDKLRAQVPFKATNRKPKDCPQVYNGDRGSRAAKWACGKIGLPYVWGSAGPNSYDCSGLTMGAWASVGIYLPHNAYSQKQSMRAVSYSQLKPGDLVFLYAGIAHVTIYVGKGWVVSAPQTGDVVRMIPLVYDSNVKGFGRPAG
jgi:cell wall-associated NlpC family hydrolase